MSSANSSTSDSLALVSSFYGSGATACWYLNFLSCLISWTLHPKKQRSDSITSDLIALVTFPTVAAAHLVAQVQDYPSQLQIDDEILQKMNACICASLTIAETYLSLCTILLFPAVLVRSIKRIMVLTLTGIFCFITETYVFFAIPSIRNSPGTFNRAFIIDSLSLLVIILTIVIVLVAMLLHFIYLWFTCHLPPLLTEPQQGADPEVVENYHYVRTAHLRVNQMVCLAYLAVLSSVGPTCFAVKDVVPSPVQEAGDKPRVTAWRKIVNEFFPRTNTGIIELDQAVALLAGMTVLGFSLYSVADEWCRNWWEEERRRREEEAERRVIDHLSINEERRRQTPTVTRVHDQEHEDVELQDLTGNIPETRTRGEGAEDHTWVLQGSTTRPYCGRQSAA